MNPGFRRLLLDSMPSSLQGDPGWDQDPMGWEKKETIPNAPPFQSVITQCPFAAFSVCVHAFSSLSSFTVCVHTVSICRLFCLRSYFFVPFKFHSLCSRSVHLPPFLSAFILFRPFQVSQSVFTQCPFATFSQSVFLQCSFAAFSVSGWLAQQLFLVIR